MAESRPERRHQMALFPEEPTPLQMSPPEAITAELVDALAELLLEAAGVHVQSHSGGCDDQSENHA